MNQHEQKAWRQYEAGKAHKRRIGLYETVRRNEAFYRGDQWQMGEGANLPKPVFNIIKRVVDFLVCSIASADINIRFSDENFPFADAKTRGAITSLLETLNKNTEYRWDNSGMSSKSFRVLTDAALSGDGALYCYWDSDARGAGDYMGDMVTDVVDSTCIFPADVNLPDIQSQEYVIISGRRSVASLRREAIANGVPAEDADKIVGDDEYEWRAGNLARYELEDEDEKKATFIIKFWREDGRVCFEKSTRYCILKRVKTDCTLYPIAFFNWSPSKNSFHGTSPVTSLVHNQKFINRAYAMAMKHMTDTAFSKIIYDKTKIPEWSNEVGEAIGALGGGNISDAVSVVPSGELQEGFLEFVNSAVSLTKELMGATDSALGNLEANNTSAILALQETSRTTLGVIRDAFYRCIEELADIWADMICAYYPADRLIPFCADGETGACTLNTDQLRSAMLKARVDVAQITRYSTVNAQNMLDKLLDGGHITPTEYIRRLPTGLLMDRQSLIEEIENRTRKEIADGQ